jgi:hypothetical protein
MTFVKDLILKKYLQNQTCGSIFLDLSKFNMKPNFRLSNVTLKLEAPEDVNAPPGNGP